MASMIDDILSQISVDELAAQLGTDPDTAVAAARQALPALLGGLNGAVQSGGGDALGAALQRDHDGSLLDADDVLGAVDVNDGQKILGHVFGGQEPDVVQALGARSGADASVFGKLLPLLAPLVMAWLSKRALGGGAAPAEAGSSGGGLGDLLGGVLGGGGGGLGDILGGLLGGEVEGTKSQMPDLGGLFDMLGGGKSAGGGSGSGLPDIGDLLGK